MTATITRTTRNRARLTALLATTALIGTGVMPGAIVVLSGTAALASGDGGNASHGGTSGGITGGGGGSGGTNGNGSTGNAGATGAAGGAGGAAPGANGTDGTEDPNGGGGGGGGASGADIAITTPTTSGNLTAGKGGNGGTGGAAGGGGGGGGGGDITVNTLNNSGVLTGGAGGHGGRGDMAGGGGGGIGGGGGSTIVTGTGTMSNSGTITGGNGGEGGIGFYFAGWSDGRSGNGGNGIVFKSADVIFTNTSSGIIRGGDSVITNGLYVPRSSGIVTQADMTIVNACTISGDGGGSSRGWGIYAERGSLQVDNSGTIRGDIGVTFGNNSILTNSGAILGSYNGVAASSATITNLAGNGVTTGLIKADEIAILMQSGTLSNYGVVDGGVQINTGTVINHAGDGVTTGVITGKSGIITDASIPGYFTPVNITNAGAIFGLNTFYGTGVGLSNGADHTVTNQAGNGDTTGIIRGAVYGIDSSRATAITNAGTIHGGLMGIRASGIGTTIFNTGTISSAGTTAIQLSGFNSSLTLGAGSIITGNVESYGSGNALQLGGTDSATFDVSQIGAAAQYRGFETFNKVGTSTWTLTGTATEATSWTLNGGTLSVASDASLGAGNAALTFNGGTLRVTGTGFTSTTRAINWGANGGGFDIADANNTFTLSGASPNFTGTGGLIKLGAGTLAIDNNPNYTGVTDIQAGTLKLGSGRLASESRHNIAAGATLDLNGTPVSLIGSLTGAGTVTTSGTGLTMFIIGSGNASATFAGRITDGATGTIRTSINSIGITTFTGTNTYTGGTIICVCSTLQVGDGGTGSQRSLWCGVPVARGLAGRLRGAGRCRNRLCGTGRLHTRSGRWRDGHL